MSFAVFARKVRDPSLPHARRVAALASCVQMYRPLGHEATLDYLEATAGPFHKDEGALLRALEVLEASRELRKRELARFAERRRAAKAAGRRVPSPGEQTLNAPWMLARWHAAPRDGALHALRFWRRSRLQLLLTGDHRPFPRVESPPDGDPDVLETLRLLEATLAAGGELPPAERTALADCTRRVLARRVDPGDGGAWSRHRALVDVLHHMKVAAEGP